MARGVTERKLRIMLHVFILPDPFSTWIFSTEVKSTTALSPQLFAAVLRALLSNISGTFSKSQDKMSPLL